MLAGLGKGTGPYSRQWRHDAEGDPEDNLICGEGYPHAARRKSTQLKADMRLLCGACWLI